MIRLASSGGIGLLTIFLVQIIVRTLIAESSNPVIEGVQQEEDLDVKNGSWRWPEKNRGRPMGCWKKGWICNARGEFPAKGKRVICCKNRCVDVSSDVNNCGLCGTRCPFTWQCCRGLCVDTNNNPFHCGRCDHKCPFPSFCCIYGMCGYAQPLPAPFPFPFPPKPFFPPKTPLRGQPPPSGG